jgi:hypothetical protein
MLPVLVDPLVSREKLRREVEFWKANGIRNDRGWILLNYDEEALSLEVGFLAKLATTSSSGFLPALVCAVRLTYENYDLWPPSLTFVDAFSRQPALPHVGALVQTQGGPRNVLISAHPATQLPFLCIPGIREYHSHPQHTGDEWLIHRSAGEGNISTICDRVWRFMVNNVIGLQVVVQAMPVWPLQAQIGIQLIQGEFIATAAAGSPTPSDQENQERTKVA